MSEPHPDALVDAVDLYVDVQQVLLNRLAPDFAHGYGLLLLPAGSGGVDVE